MGHISITITSTHNHIQLLSSCIEEFVDESSYIGHGVFDVFFRVFGEVDVFIFFPEHLVVGNDELLVVILQTIAQLGVRYGVRLLDTVYLLHLFVESLHNN